MREFATIVRRLGSLVLVIVLVVAPIAPAVAACISPTSAKAMGVEAAPLCDTPCEDCTSKTAKKSCQGECVCVKPLFDLPSIIAQRAPVSHGLMPIRDLNVIPYIYRLQ